MVVSCDRRGTESGVCSYCVPDIKLERECTTGTSVSSQKTCFSALLRVIKSRRMRWAGHVARMGEGRGVYRVLVGRPEERRPLGRTRRRWVDIILGRISRRWDMGTLAGLGWPRIETGGGRL